MARFYTERKRAGTGRGRVASSGHDAVTMRETGHAGRAVSDRQVLEFATTNGRAVVTLNRRHFVRLHLERPTHAGIVVCTYDPDFAALARRIHDATRSMPELTGQLVRVNRPS